MAAEEVAAIARAAALAALLARALAARRAAPDGRGPALADLRRSAPSSTRSRGRGAHPLDVERLAASSYARPAGLGGPLGVLPDRAGAIDGRAAPIAALRRRARRCGRAAAARASCARARLGGARGARRAAPAALHAGHAA
jgi:hypothetical protein